MTARGSKPDATATGTHWTPVDDDGNGGLVVPEWVVRSAPALREHLEVLHGHYLEPKITMSERYGLVACHDCDHGALFNGKRVTNPRMMPHTHSEDPPEPEVPWTW